VLRELAKDVFVETGYESGNVGVIRTERGGLLVDTPMLPRDARDWRAKLFDLDVDEIYAIVNTDYHPEHFIGNAFFMPTRIWGHEQAAKPISKYKTSTLEQLAASYRESDPALADEIAQIEIYEPELEVGDRVTLHLGDDRIEVLYLEGHTPASLGVYLPKAKVLFAGDNVVNNEHPALADANSLAWIETLKRIMEMDVEVIVPANGEPTGKEAVARLEEYIREMRSRVEELYQAGASRRECVEKVGMLDFYPVPEDQVSRVKRRRRESIERVYAEVRTAHPRARR
jgi:cyclase